MKSLTRECALECVGPGWAKLVNAFYDVAQCEVSQVKEKYGGLRIYVYDATDLDRDLADALEAESLQTCELCGAPGTPRDVRYWIKTLCDKHAAE